MPKNAQTTAQLHSPHTLAKSMETVTDFILVGSKITADVTEAMKLKDAFSLEVKL